MFGRLWILDRTRLEKNDVMSLPVPFESVEDPFVDAFLDSNEDERARLVCERFRLAGWSAHAFEEYVKFRKDFEDAGVPPSFSVAPDSADIEAYKNALQFAMRSVSSEKSGPQIEVFEVDSTQRRKVTIFLTPGSARRGAVESLDSMPAAWEENPVATFSDSLCISADKVHAEIRKPAERFRWTIEAGFSDARQLIQRLMETV